MLNNIHFDTDFHEICGKGKKKYLILLFWNQPWNNLINNTTIFPFFEFFLNLILIRNNLISSDSIISQIFTDTKGRNNRTKKSLLPSAIYHLSSYMNPTDGTNLSKSSKQQVFARGS